MAFFQIECKFNLTYIFKGNNLYRFIIEKKQIYRILENDKKILYIF